jgi:ABC-type dipeptide/oligopeptide/nickel transport system permease component
VRGTDYIVKRTLFAIVTVFVAITLNFVLFRLLPGNAVAGLRCQHCTKQFRESIVKQYGLDKPKLQQYVIYVERLAHGDLGTSIADNRPVWDDIRTPLVNTLPMIVAGTVISIIIGIISGVVAAWRRGTAADSANLWTALAFYAMPTQWIALLVIFYIAIPLGLPASGIESNTLGILSTPSTWAVFSDRVSHLSCRRSRSESGCTASIRWSCARRCSRPSARTTCSPPGRRGCATGRSCGSMRCETRCFRW